MKRAKLARVESLSVDDPSAPPKDGSLAATVPARAMTATCMHSCILSSHMSVEKWDEGSRRGSGCVRCAARERGLNLAALTLENADS